MTYSELQQAVARYMHRTDLALDIPLMIQMAADDIRENLRSMLNQASIQITEADRVLGGVYDLPADFLQVNGLSTNVPRGTIELAAVGRQELAKFSRAGSQTPWVYSIFSNQVQFAPTPPDGAVMDLIYFTNPGPLVEPTDTNDILTEQPQLYLYLALSHGHTLAQDHQQAGTCAARADVLMRKMNAQSDRARYGAAPTGSGDYNYSSAPTWGNF